MGPHLEPVSEISLEVARPILTLPPTLRLRKPMNIYDSSENPLHRYIDDYQGFNPLQTLNFSRYTAAT